jgi:DNA repair exonuclease SbcCD nuclease subunit
MKVALIGDCHFRTTVPRARKDDFVKTQLFRLMEVLNLIRDRGCDLLLQTGDFFDSPRPSYWLVREIMRKFRTKNYMYSRNTNDQMRRPFFTVLGQHDMYMHSLKSHDRTAMALMCEAGIVDILGTEVDSPRRSPKVTRTDGKYSVRVSGCCWGQKIPPVPESEPETFQALIVHQMIGPKPLYPNQEIEDPLKVLTGHNYDLVLCGDYHYPFQYTVDKQWIVNPGCLFRLTTSENDLALKPGICIWDAEAGTVTRHELSYRPIEEVFDLSAKETPEAWGEKRDAFREFLARLLDNSKVGASFKENLMKLIEAHGAEEPVRGVLSEVLEEAGYEK